MATPLLPVPDTCLCLLARLAQASAARTDRRQTGGVDAGSAPAALPLPPKTKNKKLKTESGCHTPRPICIFAPPREAGASRFFTSWQVRDFPTENLEEAVCVVVPVYRNVRVWSCARRRRREPPSATSSRRDHVRCDQRSKSAMDYLSPDASAPGAPVGPYFSRAAPC